MHAGGLSGAKATTSLRGIKQKMLRWTSVVVFARGVGHHRQGSSFGTSPGFFFGGGRGASGNDGYDYDILGSVVLCRLELRCA